MAESLTLSIHGPGGVLDLVVPAAATTHDVARAYAAEAQLPSIPLLRTALGEHLSADQEVEESGLRSGDVLVAVLGLSRTGATSAADDKARPTEESGTQATAVMFAASLVALVAGWFAARAGEDETRLLVAASLALTGVLCLLPTRYAARQRLLAAPAFGAASTYAVLAGERDYLAPAVVAVCALVAAAVAGVARTLAPDPGAAPAEVGPTAVGEGLTVWVVTGLSVAVVTGAAVLAGTEPPVPWAVLLMGAVMACRVAPSFVVEVPDEALLDLDRLAVTAWSARDEQPGRGRRGRIVVPESDVRDLVHRGTRLVTGTALAVLAVVVVAATQLRSVVEVDVEVVGARALLFFGGAALFLTARSFRHRAARALLRVAGLWCAALLVLELFTAGSVAVRTGVLVAAVMLGLLCVAAGVATGRGWRSVWWARRAEVAETVTVAFAIASTAAASGLVRFFWEMNS